MPLIVDRLHTADLPASAVVSVCASVRDDVTEEERVVLVSTSEQLEVELSRALDNGCSIS
jgi:hypothetical protein